MTINRNDFLRLSAWSLVATLLPINQINALSFITDLNSFDKDNYNLAVTTAKEAKEAFFKKKFKIAEKLYLECIKLAPADVRFYDNLQNVYSAQGKWLMNVELFKNGLVANPEKAVFYDRSARSIIRLEIGHQLVAKKYKQEINSNSLLDDAEKLFKKGIEIENKKYLQIGLDKVKLIKIYKSKDLKSKKTNKVLNKRLNRNKYHERHEKVSNVILLERIKKIDAKKRNTLYFKNEIAIRKKFLIKEKKQLYTILVNRFRKDKEYNKAIKYANQIYSIDKKDTQGLKLLKELYLKTNQYDKLIAIQREHNLYKQTVFSHLGLMHALNLKYKHFVKDSGLLKESITIANSLLNEWGLFDGLKTKVIIKLANTYILNYSFKLAKDILRDNMKTTSNNSEGHINSLLHAYAKVYFEEGKYEESKEIILIGINENHNNTNFQYVEDFALKKKKNTFNKNLNLYYMLYNIYDKLGDNIKKDEILKNLINNNPKDSFCSKRI